jgi:hypothetical protein
VDLERVPLSLVSTAEELIEIKSTAVGIRHADHVTPSIRKHWHLTSPTSGGRSFGIVRSRTQTVCKLVFTQTLLQLTLRAMAAR